MRHVLIGCCAWLAFTTVARAVDLAVWTFEVSVPAHAGPHAAEGGIHGGEATGFHANPATVYSNPVGNGSLESFSSNTWNPGDYYQFSTSTAGHGNITISWDQTRSSTGPADFMLMASADGVNFNPIFSYSVPVVTWNGTTRGPTTFVAPPVPGLENLPVAYFRLLNQSPPSAAAGTNRVDNVVIAGDAGGVPGACCFPGGGCVETDQSLCSAQGGIPQGPGTICTPTTCQPDQPCSDGGPGPHWVDTTPAGNDNMQTGALVGIDTNLDCVRDQNLVLFGPASVQRANPQDDSGNFPGTRPIDGHLDVIDTEMLSMSLSGGGVTLTAGAGLGAIPLSSTKGNIAELPADPTQADSFFDVFFEVDLGGGQRLYNQTPLRVQAVIDCAPPTRIYFHPIGICIPLYTSPTPGVGVHVANLVSARHDPFPTPGACCFQGTECAEMISVECEAAGGEFQGEGSLCGPETCQPDQPCSDGGPGPHWVDNTPAGSDNMPTGALVGIDTNLDCVRDQNLVLFGPAAVQRGNPLDDSNTYPGTRPLDGHLDVIDTEMLSMSLSGGGVTLTAGAGLGAIPLSSSLGNIAEQPGNPSLADSFFDVFFEVDLGGGNRLYNQTPLRVQAVIDCVPPNRMYFHPVGICVALYTSPIPGQGIHVANLVSANHDPFPQPGACCLPPPIGQCIETTSAECEAQGGEFQGEGSVCGPTTCQPDQPCSDGGPGPHWVDNTPAGNDSMSTGALVGIDTDLDCVRDQNLVLFGPASVQRSNPLDDSGQYPGTRPIDGHLDVIDTEMLSMSLSGGGVTLTAGAGLGAIPLSSSLGNIAELPSDPTLADSFFDVFFEVDLGGGNRVYNQAPLRVQAVIDCVPPTRIYFHPTGICIPLYTSPIAGQGVHVANLVSANHDPFPQPGACCLPNGQCINTTSVECGALGGEFQGEGTACQGDLNGNGIDDLCEDQPCEDGGPGPHWVDTTPAGNDLIPTGALVGIDTNLDCVRDQNLVLFGPAGIRRGNPLDDSGQFPGTRPIDGHLDVIDTEMLSMSLSGGGVTLTAGAGLGAIPLGSTLGNIAEQPGDPSLADSFFDIFFEVDLGGGNRLYNQTPLRVQAVIDCVPPNRMYFHPVGICVALFTSPVPGQGIHVANLVSARHDPFPQPGACCLPGNECAVMTDIECEAAGGQFQGEGSLCGPDTCQPDQPCSDGGPGPHWVDTTPAGTDNMPTGALVGIDTNLDCVRDQNLVLFGPASVQRSNPLDDSGQYPGTRPIDGHLDVIDTEMLSMSLTGGGVTLTAGAGLGAIPLSSSLGNIAELPSDPALADSFFDVFFEVDLGGGNRLYNQTPLRVQAVIDCVPPNRVYFHPVNICIPLYTSPIPGAGVHVANLVSANHDPFPEPGACCLPNGQCMSTTNVECEAQGGEFQGEGTACQGDLNGNGIDDLCEGQPCDECGPGPHWIHNPPCPAGTDHLPTGALVGIDTNLDCSVDTNLVLGGPSSVRRTGPIDDSGQFPGTRPIDGHLDVLDTEMVALSLSGGGVTLTAGAGLGAIPLAASLGNIAEQPGNPSLADSFFDVFFELDLGGGNRVYNQQPLPVQAVIDCVSPRGIYAHPTGLCIPLYTSPIPGAGVHVANLVSANHSVGVPQATVTSAVSRRSNPRPPGFCDTNLLPPRRSEPHQGGVQQVRIAFDVAPGGGGSGATLEQATCAAPAFVPYAGASTMSGAVVGNELIMSFTPGLENGRTYRINLGPAITSIAGQSVEVRGLTGDVNGDGSVNATDRSVVVGAWTGPGGFTCSTDVNNDGNTNATDRSIVVGAWTGGPGVNCAP